MNKIARPLADRILVKQLEAKTETESGIELPETARERPMKGEVVGVGRGRNINEPNECQIGDTVIYGRFSGTEIEIDNNQYIILRESEIYAIL